MPKNSDNESCCPLSEQVDNTQNFKKSDREACSLDSAYDAGPENHPGDTAADSNEATITSEFACDFLPKADNKQFKYDCKPELEKECGQLPNCYVDNQNIDFEEVDIQEVDPQKQEEQQQWHIDPEKQAEYQHIVTLIRNKTAATLKAKQERENRENFIWKGGPLKLTGILLPKQSELEPIDHLPPNFWDDPQAPIPDEWVRIIDWDD